MKKPDSVIGNRVLRSMDEFRDVVDAEDAKAHISSEPTMMALIDVVADLHGMTSQEVTDLVIQKLR
jgi:hypothetical protein